MRYKMKLRNKRTGEIRELPDGFFCGDNLKKICEEWEDAPEEPKEYWFIDPQGEVASIHEEDEDEEYTKATKEIGDYFETKEEAELAVRKLKAWKRLKDKGFRFEGWEDLQAKMGIDEQMLFNRDIIDTNNVIGFMMDDYHDCIKDLNTCFGGEE